MQKTHSPARGSARNTYESTLLRSLRRDIVPSYKLETMGLRLMRTNMVCMWLLGALGLISGIVLATLYTSVGNPRADSGLSMDDLLDVTLALEGALRTVAAVFVCLFCVFFTTRVVRYHKGKPPFAYQGLLIAFLVLFSMTPQTSLYGLAVYWKIYKDKSLIDTAGSTSEQNKQSSEFGLISYLKPVSLANFSYAIVMTAFTMTFSLFYCGGMLHLFGHFSKKRAFESHFDGLDEVQKTRAGSTTVPSTSSTAIVSSGNTTDETKNNYPREATSGRPRPFHSRNKHSRPSQSMLEEEEFVGEGSSERAFLHDEDDHEGMGGGGNGRVRLSRKKSAANQIKRYYNMIFIGFQIMIQTQRRWFARYTGHMPMSLIVLALLYFSLLVGFCLSHAYFPSVIPIVGLITVYRLCSISNTTDWLPFDKSVTITIPIPSDPNANFTFTFAVRLVSSVLDDTINPCSPEQPNNEMFMRALGVTLFAFVEIALLVRIYYIFITSRSILRSVPYAKTRKHQLGFAHFWTFTVVVWSFISIIGIVNAAVIPEDTYVVEQISSESFETNISYTSFIMLKVNPFFQVGITPGTVGFGSYYTMIMVWMGLLAFAYLPANSVGVITGWCYGSSESASGIDKLDKSNDYLLLISKEADVCRLLEIRQKEDDEFRSLLKAQASIRVSKFTASTNSALRMHRGGVGASPSNSITEDVPPRRGSGLDVDAVRSSPSMNRGETAKSLSIDKKSERTTSLNGTIQMQVVVESSSSLNNSSGNFMPHKKSMAKLARMFSYRGQDPDFLRGDQDAAESSTGLSPVVVSELVLKKIRLLTAQIRNNYLVLETEILLFHFMHLTYCLSVTKMDLVAINSTASSGNPGNLGNLGNARNSGNSGNAGNARNSGNPGNLGDPANTMNPAPSSVVDAGSTTTSDAAEPKAVVVTPAPAVFVHGGNEQQHHPQQQHIVHFNDEEKADDDTIVVADYVADELSECNSNDDKADDLTLDADVDLNFDYALNHEHNADSSPSNPSRRATQSFTRRKLTMEEKHAFVEDARFTLLEHIEATNTDTHAFIFESDDRIVLAFRGTASSVNWKTDMDSVEVIMEYLTEVEPVLNDLHGASLAHAQTVSKLPPLVHRGFVKAYDSIKERVNIRMKNVLDRRHRPIFVTGHSLGGGLAIICICDLVKTFHIPPSRVALTTWGCPKVGTYSFATRFERICPCARRFVVVDDVVVKLPIDPLFADYTLKGWWHVGTELLLDDVGNLLIRPSPIERFLQARTIPNPAAHLRMSYATSLMLWTVRAHPDYHPDWWVSVINLFHVNGAKRLKKVPANLRDSLLESLSRPGVSYVYMKKFVRDCAVDTRMSAAFAGKLERVNTTSFLDDEEEESRDALKLLIALEIAWHAKDVPGFSKYVDAVVELKNRAMREFNVASENGDGKGGVIKSKDNRVLSTDDPEVQDSLLSIKDSIVSNDVFHGKEVNESRIFANLV